MFFTFRAPRLRAALPQWSITGVKRHLRRRRAAVALATALLAPALLGFSGFAVDIGYWYAAHADDGISAQAAAMAAARASSYGVLGQAALQTVAGKAGAAAVTGGDAGIALLSATQTRTEVDAAQHDDSLFARLWGQGGPIEVGDRAAARVVPTAAGGVLIAPALP